MAVSNTVKLGTIGAKIQVTITVSGATYNVTGATVTLTVKKPGGDTATWTMTLDTPLRGIVSYTTTAVTDLDEAGTWQFEPKIIEASGDTFYGDTGTFVVEDVLD